MRHSFCLRSIKTSISFTIQILFLESMSLISPLWFELVIKIQILDIEAPLTELIKANCEMKVGILPSWLRMAQSRQERLQTLYCSNLVQEVVESEVEIKSQRICVIGSLFTLNLYIVMIHWNWFKFDLTYLSLTFPISSILFLFGGVATSLTLRQKLLWSLERWATMNSIYPCGYRFHNLKSNTNVQATTSNHHTVLSSLDWKLECGPAQPQLV